ncbi:MAG: hypothetical protein FJ139_10175 [Deltaproteobacteria bacterium]|nr:hypothetical protein [Deltaproteobacteria bacterium]
MPKGDRTGPAGFGPMTGRGVGFCAGYPVPGYMNPAGGRGFGFWGRGGGRGWRNWFHATGLTGWQRAGRWLPASGWGIVPSGTPMTAKEEKEMLKEQVEFFRSQMEELQKRISTLEKEEK